MSVAQTVKAYLLGESGVLAPLLSGVTVGYSASPNVPMEEVYGGRVGGPVSLAAFAPASGRVRRTEELTLMVHIRVRKKGQRTAETAEARAVEISDVITQYIALNPTLGGLAELRKAAISNVDYDSSPDDDGVTAFCDISVELMSYLT